MAEHTRIQAEHRRGSSLAQLPVATSSTRSVPEVRCEEQRGSSVLRPWHAVDQSNELPRCRRLQELTSASASNHNRFAPWKRAPATELCRCYGPVAAPPLPPFPRAKATSTAHALLLLYGFPQSLNTVSSSPNKCACPARHFHMKSVILEQEVCPATCQPSLSSTALTAPVSRVPIRALPCVTQHEPLTAWKLPVQGNLVPGATANLKIPARSQARSLFRVSPCLWTLFGGGDEDTYAGRDREAIDQK